jgi:hypothetical protein
MSKENLVKLFFLLVTVLILSVLISDIFKSCSRNDKPNIIVMTDTVWAKPDTVRIPKYLSADKVPAKIDTVFIDNEAIEYAISDTVTFYDSSKIWVRYYSPPLNVFDIEADIKEKVITKSSYITKTIEIEKPTTFWDRFNWTIYAGQGYDIIHKDYSISVGVGIGFNLGKIF